MRPVGKLPGVVNLLYIPLIALAVLLVTGIALRVVPATIEGVRFRQVSAPYANDFVASYANGTYDARFGYPSGFFSINEKASRAGQKVVLDEAHPSGAVSDGCAIGIGSMAFEGSDSGCLVGALTFFLVFMIALPFIVVSLLDRIIRRLLKSRITVDLRRDGEDVVADMTFRGISARLAKQQYERAFARPSLPETVFPPLTTPPVIDAAAA